MYNLLTYQNSTKALHAYDLAIRKPYNGPDQLQCEPSNITFPNSSKEDIFSSGHYLVKLTL